MKYAEDDIAATFYYELTPEPTALFKDGMMRKTPESVLRNSATESITPKDRGICVIDGGTLLYKFQTQIELWGSA